MPAVLSGFPNLKGGPMSLQLIPKPFPSFSPGRALLLHEKEAKKLLFKTIEPELGITGPVDIGLIIRKVYIGLVRITKDS